MIYIIISKIIIYYFTFSQQILFINYYQIYNNFVGYLWYYFDAPNILLITTDLFLFQFLEIENLF